MLIRLLADVESLKYTKGEIKEVSLQVGCDLISESLAVEVKGSDRAVDQKANQALTEARRRDEPKE